MKYLLFLAMLASTTVLGACDGEDGEPMCFFCPKKEEKCTIFNCPNPDQEERRTLSSEEVAGLLGTDEAKAALLLDDAGHEPALDRESDTLFYRLTERDLDALAGTEY